MVPWPFAAQEVPRERLWSIPQEGIGRPDVTGPIGRFEKDASGMVSGSAQVSLVRMDLSISTICEVSGGSKSAPNAPAARNLLLR